MTSISSAPSSPALFDRLNLTLWTGFDALFLSRFLFSKRKATIDMTTIMGTIDANMATAAVPGPFVFADTGSRASHSALTVTVLLETVLKSKA